jgi:two-component system response regulator DevR
MAIGDVAAGGATVAGGDGGARIGVFVLSEHDLVRQGLVDLVTAEPDMVVVGAAATAEEGLPAMAASPPQVVLVDTQLPDSGAIAGCRQVRVLHPQALCLLLTSFDDDEALFTAVMAGAAGYLIKEVGGSRLLDGIRAVAGGRLLLDAGVVGRLLDRLRHAGLDAYEEQLLELVSRGSTDAQIAQQLGRAADAVTDDVTALTAKLAHRRREP